MTSFTSTYTGSIATAPASKAPSLFARIGFINTNYRTRHQLRNLTETQMRDMGLTAADVAQELKKPLWNAPAHWTA